MNKHLIIYARKPEARKSKTRLGKSIGYEQAAGVYARLLFSYLDDVLRSEPIMKNVVITLSVADIESEAFFSAAFPEFRVVTQVAAEIGKRMQKSFTDVFRLGAEFAVLTGSDVPFLNANRILEAFERLNENDVVIGPAEDGGYFLVGMKQPGWGIFENIPWSTERVMSETIKQVESLGLPYALLPVTFDLDIEADYQRWVEIIQSR